MKVHVVFWRFKNEQKSKTSWEMCDILTALPSTFKYRSKKQRAKQIRDVGAFFRPSPLLLHARSSQHSCLCCLLFHYSPEKENKIFPMQRFF